MYITDFIYNWLKVDLNAGVQLRLWANIWFHYNLYKLSPLYQNYSMYISCTLTEYSQLSLKHVLSLSVAWASVLGHSIATFLNPVSWQTLWNWHINSYTHHILGMYTHLSTYVHLGIATKFQEYFSWCCMFMKLSPHSRFVSFRLLQFNYNESPTKNDVMHHI